MDHLVIPLDVAHVRSLDELVEGAASAAGQQRASRRPDPHITLIAYRDLPARRVAAAITPVVTATAPFAVHAHGYGFFTGPDHTDLSLHVPVVRDAPLDALHTALCYALGQAGAEIAGWSVPALWSPHVTLVDRWLDPAALGRAAAWLARRHHPSWRIPVDRVAHTGGWSERHRRHAVFALGTTANPVVAGMKGART